MTAWFTSDPHWGHAKIIEYDKRPFKDVDEMDEALIKNWNEVVLPGDCVYILGDLCFYRDVKKKRELMHRLLGQKFLVRGNHDKKLEDEILDMFVWVRDLTQITVEKQKIVLCHYAMKTWEGSHRGTWQLFGHSHGSLAPDPRSLQLDVGSNCHNYRPISFDEVKRHMSTKTFKPVDHHGRRPGDDK